MFTLPQIKVNLFDLYLTSPGEEIIIKFLSLTQDGFRVRINNSEVELPLRNFTVRRLISRFNIYKIAVITDSGDKPSYLVYVDETMCVKIDQAIVGLLEAKMPQMSAVNLADHPESRRCQTWSSLTLTTASLCTTQVNRLSAILSHG